MKRIATTIYLTDELYEQARKHAFDHKSSVSELIRMLLAQFFTATPPPPAVAAQQP